MCFCNGLYEGTQPPNSTAIPVDTFALKVAVLMFAQTCKKEASVNAWVPSSELNPNESGKLNWARGATSIDSGVPARLFVDCRRALVHVGQSLVDQSPCSAHCHFVKPYLVLLGAFLRFFGPHLAMRRLMQRHK